MFWLNLKSVASPVPEIIAMEFWVGVANPKSWGRLGRRGSGMVAFERALVTSYRLSMVTFPLSLVFTRFRDRPIAAFVLQHTTFNQPPLVSSKFPLVPLGLGGWPFGYKERRCWANCQCN